MLTSGISAGAPDLLVQAPETETIACMDCGTTFRSKPVVVGDVVFPAMRRCPNCQAMHERKFADERARREQFVRLKQFNDHPELPEDTREAELHPLMLKRLPTLLGWQFGKKGVLLHGASGRSKTRAVWLLLRRLYVDDGVAFTFYKATQFARAVEAARGWGLGEFVQDVANVPVFVLDDFGKERMSEAVAGALWEVLERRMMSREPRPVIVTTNHRGTTLPERFIDQDNGKAIVRRIVESTGQIGLWLPEETA